MKIFYKDIVDDEVAIKYNTSFEDEYGRYEGIEFSGVLRKLSPDYTLIGELKFSFYSVCDRCLDDVKIDISEEVSQLISPTDRYLEQQSEAGLTDDEVEIYVTSSENIDIAEFIREEVLLQTPMKRLCIDDCKGCCEVCGINLNNGSCNCKDNNQRNPFSKLNRLK